EQPSDCCPAL
ncbi:rCG31977, partial [Rattus norvegicus]